MDVRDNHCACWNATFYWNFQYSLYWAAIHLERAITRLWNKTADSFAWLSEEGRGISRGSLPPLSHSLYLSVSLCLSSLSPSFSFTLSLSIYLPVRAGSSQFIPRLHETGPVINSIGAQSCTKLNSQVQAPSQETQGLTWALPSRSLKTSTQSCTGLLIPVIGPNYTIEFQI